MRKEKVRKIAPSTFLVLAFAILCFTGTAFAYGPTTLPGWADDAQVKWGWDFSEGGDPSEPEPITDWQTSTVGSNPSFTGYTESDEVEGTPALYDFYIPNLDNNNPVKHFWLEYYYEHLPFDYGQGDRTGTDVTWYPFDTYDVIQMEQQDYETEGYGRVTWELELYPNPSYEEITISLYGIWVDDPFEGPFWVEPELFQVYVLTECEQEQPVPEPATMFLLGSGLVGLAGLGRRRFRKKN